MTATLQFGFHATVALQHTVTYITSLQGKSSALQLNFILASELLDSLSTAVLAAF